MKYISKTVVLLSFVSLFTDMASEMLYPVMPLYLKQIGYTALFIGILEGVAECIAGLTKPYFGKWSDATGKRLPYVQVGYMLSAISKPMLAIFVYPWWIFLSRSIDRLGKGIRTGARDGLLSDECTPETRGRIFGFHRSLDTLGAVAGPLLALVFLHFYPDDYASLFLMAFLPGLLAVACSIFIKERARPAQPTSNINFLGFWTYAKTGSWQYRKLLVGLLSFALINSSDVFLLLKMKEEGLQDTEVISMYILYNLVFAMLAYPVGIIADKIGFRKIMVAGLAVFGLVYFGFAVANKLFYFGCLFVLYGLYAAATEGISKAWISRLVPKTETATAIGTYSGFQSIAALFASLITGFIWYKLNGTIALCFIAFGAFSTCIYLSTLSEETYSKHM